MNQAYTKPTNHRYWRRGVTERPMNTRSDSLLVRLVQALSPSPLGDVHSGAPQAAALLGDLLSANGRRWPQLRDPRRLSFDLTFRNDRLQIRVEPVDQTAPLLEVHFDRGGKLLTWQSWSTSP